MSYFWIGIIVVAIGVEIATTNLVAIWFMPAALVSAILAFCNIPPVVQVLLFLVLSAVGIVLSRIFLKKAPKADARTNINAIVGEKCIVTEQIDNYAGHGQAKVKGQIWSARSVSDEDVVEVGEVLLVVAIEGVKLICKKQ